MTNGFDLLGRTRVLQVHWLKRIAAFIVDSILVLIPTWVALTLMKITAIEMFGLASGLAFLFYSTLSEAVAGQTLGKALLNLKVRSSREKVSLGMAFTRSVPKFFWYLFPMLDVILGLALEGDPRQRLSDRIFGTTVVQAHYLKVKVHRVEVKERKVKPLAKA